MTTFIKWFLLNAVFLTALFFAESKGAISLMVKSDISHLTIVIMTLYVAVSGMTGHLCYLADQTSGNRNKDIKERDRLTRRAEVGWFAAEHFFSLGLLGTVFGLCVATATSLNEGSEVTDIVSGLKTGLNTAFYTTICGIVFSLLLQVQLMILRFKLEE
jgi:hypothetical protein